MSNAKKPGQLLKTAPQLKLFFMELNGKELATAFALTLDFLEKEFRGSAENNNKRTGLIAVYLGRVLRFSDSELFDLSACAMLHDNRRMNATMP